MLELYHWEPNTFFLKPLIALEEKRIQFTSRYFDAAALEQMAENFPANTESRLQLEREGPLLVDGGTVISGSFFILEYIAEALPGADLKPAGPYAHYQMQAWGQRFSLLVAPAVSTLGCAKYLAPLLAKQDQAGLQARIDAIEPQERRDLWAALIDGRYTDAALTATRKRLVGPIRRVENALASSHWLGGEAYSIADIDAYAMLKVLPDLAPEVVNSEATPRIMGFLDRMSEREAVKGALLESRTGHPETCFVPGVEPSRWG